MHQSFVTTAPPPLGNCKDFWLFVQKIPAISPTLRGQTVGKTTAICLRGLLGLPIRSCNPRYFQLKNKTPPLTRHGADDAKVKPGTFSLLSPTLPWGWECRGCNWLVHKNTVAPTVCEYFKGYMVDTWTNDGKLVLYSATVKAQKKITFLLVSKTDIN